MGIFRRGFQAMFERSKWKILRGDKVMITVGKDRGQEGIVVKVIRDEKFPRVVVEGLNLSKRHIKRTEGNPGGIVSVESPLHYSNVSLVDPVTNSPVRVAWRYLEDGTKVRVTRGRMGSDSVIPRPEVLKQRRKPRPVTAGPGDTAAAQAQVVTHTPGELPTALKLYMRRSQLHTAAAGSEWAGVEGAAVAAAAAPGPFAVGRLRGGLVGSWRGFAAAVSSL